MLKKRFDASLNCKRGAVACAMLLSVVLPVGAAYDFYKPVLVPEPVKAQWQTDVCVRLEKGAAVVRIICPRDETEAVREWFGRHFKSAFGFDCTLKMVEGDVKGQKTAESYEISADPAGGVEIRAQGLVGVRHAFHTMRQIAMRDRVGLTSEKWILPAFRIVDSPKLAFRGFHVCWFPEQRVEHIERQIRLAAYYKFNVVVLENWGVYRSEKYPWFGWKDGKMTRAEIRRLVSLAADEGLALVPQLNIWGHASLSRVRTGNHATLDFASEYEPLFEPYSGWNWCLSNPAARQVIKDLVVEMHEAFGNPRYFHIGCDEGCPPTCPKCRAADYNELFSTLVREVVDVLASRGADVLMWHDMLLAKGDSRWGGFYANGDSRAEELLRSLPKSLIVCDWYYGGPQKDYPTVDYFKTQGFRVVTSPSVGYKEGITAQGEMAVAKGIFGLLQTNWTLYYGNDFSEAFPRSACAAWGTDWHSRPLHQDMTAPVNAHMRQVLRDMGNSDRALTGFFAEQVPSAPVTPL